MSIRQKRFLSIAIAAISSAILLYAIVLAYDTPGGIADWRMSRTLGQNGTNAIPIGNTPEEAVRKFRHFPSMQVIDQEPVKDGVLLFIKRFYQKDGQDLQVEYVRKTWLGWKWVWGGGYGIGGSRRPGVADALDYMSMPGPGKLSTPFPIVFGDVLDASIDKVTVEVRGAGESIAKLAGAENGHRIWFAMLPSTGFTPFEIMGYTNKGELVAQKTITDPDGFGSISFGKE